MRGTDKFLHTKVGPEKYFPLIDSYIAQRGGGGQTIAIFIATDDESYLNQTQARYGSQVIVQPGVVRAKGKTATWKAGTSTDAATRGSTSVIDALLLSKCDFLIKSSSAVSEYAIYWNPSLVHRTYDFDLPDQPTPDWNTGIVVEPSAEAAATSSNTKLYSRNSTIGVPLGCLSASTVNSTLEMGPTKAKATIAGCSATDLSAATTASSVLDGKFEILKSDAKACSTSSLLSVKKQTFSIGWTSHLHSWLKAYMTAYKRGKTLLSPPAEKWVDWPSLCGSDKTISCFFEPAECPSGNTSGADEISTLLDVDPKETNIEYLESWHMRGDTVIPEDFRSMGWFWWSSTLMARAFRPNANLRQAVLDTMEKTGLGAALASGKVIGMQIRRGDKCVQSTWSACEGLTQYMSKAEELRAAYGINTIYLATDAQSVIEQTKAYTNWTFIHLQQGVDVSVLMNVLYPPSQGYIWDSVVEANAKGGKAYLNTLAAWVTQLDAILLSKCDAFIGQFSSNVFRAAYELNAGETNTAAPFYSLDAPWCFDWPIFAQQNLATGHNVIC